MNIANVLEKGNLTIKPYFRLISLILLAFIGLGIVIICKETSNRPPLTITQNTVAAGVMAGDNTTVYGSKTGSKYYFPWCGSLSRIKPENRVSFASAEAARVAGYQPALNCKGVK